MTKSHHSPLWDWTCGITQSALDKFLQCPEQFSLEYLEGITSKRFSVPLEFGTVIHLAIRNQDKISSFEEAQQLICEICEDYHTQRYFQLSSELDRSSCGKTMAAAEAIFPQYWQYVAEDDSRQEWLSREEVFSVRYEPCVGERSDPFHFPPIQLLGVRDGTYRTRRKGYLGLFETKTKSLIDDNLIQSNLRADLQTMFYLFALWQETGELPRQVLYNVIRRPQQKFLDKDNFRSFKERIVWDVTKRPSYYFRRWEVNVIKRDLVRFQQRILDPALRELWRWWEGTQMYSYMVMGRKEDYFVRSSVFPELSPDYVATHKESKPC